MKNTPRLFFYHISLLITHFNEWNTPQTKKLSGALIIYINILAYDIAILTIQIKKVHLIHYLTRLTWGAKLASPPAHIVH